MEPNTDFNLNQLVSRILQRLRLILGIGFLGALTGLVFSLVKTPQYQAHATLGVNINYGVTEPLALVVEDRTLSRIATVLTSDSTLMRVLYEIPEELRHSRGWSAPSDLDDVVRLDRRLAEWWLVATDEDPTVAAEVSQKWAMVSLEVLDEAVEHAWRAVEILSGSFVVECEQNIVEIWECQAVPIEVDSGGLGETLQIELDQSRGVLPNVSYELLSSARLPQNPALWSRGPLILSGMVAGLIVGAAINLVDWNPFKRQ